MTDHRPAETPIGEIENKSDVLDMLGPGAQLTYRHLEGRAQFARYIRYQGEIDPEEYHQHEAAVTQIHQKMEALEVTQQSLMELVFPLDGSDPVPLDRPAQLASELGVSDDTVRELYASALTTLGQELYGR